MIEYIIDEDYIIISFPKKLDANEIIKFEADLIEQISSHKGKIIFDLEGVSFISSMFLRVCQEVVHQKGKENFLLINVYESLHKIFNISEYDKSIEIIYAT